MLAILNGMVGVLCTVGPVLGIQFGGLEVANPAAATREMLQILAYYPAIHFVLAWHTLARRGWAIWAGAVISPLLAVWAIGVIVGWVGSGNYYGARDPAMRLSLELAAESMLVL